jgi:hypothetical protein
LHNFHNKYGKYHRRKYVLQTLLYGDPDITFNEKIALVEVVHQLINETGRFMQIFNAACWFMVSCQLATTLCIITHTASASLPMMHLAVMSIKHKHPYHWMHFLLVDCVNVDIVTCYFIQTEEWRCVLSHPLIMTMITVLDTRLHVLIIHMTTT